jgi:hypothetical protein
VNKGRKEITFIAFIRCFMQHFTKRIEVEGYFYSFYFNRIYTVEGVRYHVSVVDRNRKAHSFNMKKDEGKWVLANPRKYSGWIVKLESKLSDIIIENQSGES